MKIFIKLAFKDQWTYFLNFKDQVNHLSENEFLNYYANNYGLPGRDTDLNQECIQRILQMLNSEKILEVGHGSGHLSGLLSSAGNQVTACDISVTTEIKNRYRSVNFVTASAESLPFADKQFDAVVCTHTLEHVRNLPLAISELRRVCNKKLIIVVPKQRPYQYTFDLHLHFFPYEFSLRQTFLPPSQAKVTIENLSGDWFYVEDFSFS